MSNVMRHVSHVTCHMSHVKFNMSCVTCHFFLHLFFLNLFLDKVLEIDGGGSVINGAYPVYFVVKVTFIVGWP